MNLQLNDHVVIVTGGAAGIGGAISLLLAEEGAIPIILGRSAMTAEFSQRLSSLQPRAKFFQVDLRDETGMRRCGEPDTAGIWPHKRPCEQCRH